MMPMATWEKPKMENDRCGKYRHRENTTNEICENGRKAEYLTTWTIPVGAASRQIDYITINAMYRNTAGEAQSNTSWNANMNRNQQRRVQKMQLYYNAAKKYKTPTPEDTWGT